MTSVKLFAGLGNQLFQYAYGLALRSRGERVRFILRPGKGTITDVFDLGDPSILEVGNVVVASLAKAWAKYVEGSYQVGFFQSAEYAAIARESGRFTFRKASSFESSPWANAIAGSDSVSVHVRGGDYLREGIAGVYGQVCGPDYYARAFASIRSQVDQPRFFVLTDDAEHAKRTLAGLEGSYTLVGDAVAGDPAFDLWLMSHCAHHIIANSTFSWWGAFLGAGVGRLTVCPHRWTLDDSVDPDSLLPPTWIRIPT